jgi:sulfatase maturation enzyme AslB (radical SAM superfamily)
MYPDALSDHYNIKRMTIQEWVNSEPMRQARMSMHGSKKNSFCSRCYHDQAHSGTSRRHKCNQKSVIFTKTNFEESYLQSPGYEKFELVRVRDGSFDEMPIDLHIDLGNYCNLACKMCRPQASSTIAVQEVKWGNTEAKKYVGSDWTRDEQVWSRVLAELVSIKNLNNVHFMGGETLITDRFRHFIDYMIEHQRTDLNISFVTNGTSFDHDLMTKLKQFGRVGIEISVETTTPHNEYQRQGTNNAQVLENIQRYLSFCNNTNITLTARPAISALTIGYYDSLLRYCLDHGMIIKSLWVITPSFLNPQILPDRVKLQYLKKYQTLLDEYNLKEVDHSMDYNESDPNQLSRIVASQVAQCINMLQQPRLPNSDQLIKQMVSWCRKWDNVYGYNALDLYPELREEFVDNGY